MDWILEHIWVLVAIGTVIARLLMKRKTEDGKPGGQAAPPKEFEVEDPALAERTRKIREEIQRKIAERRGQYQQPPVLPPASPRPVPLRRSPEATTPPLQPPIAVLLEALRPKLEPVPARREAASYLAEETDRQKALAEKLKEADLMKVAAQRRLALEAASTEKERAVLSPACAGVLEDLHSAPALRRAFVLREVIGPPVGLR